MLSVIIPSRTELFLEKTIKDVLANATGEIEVFPVLDGYSIPDREIVKDSRVKYLSLAKSLKTQKRHAINEGVAQAKGQFVMSLDAHCLVAKGFDEQLAKDHKPGWVQIPRRHRLDAENWCLQAQSDNRPPIDYEYIIWHSLVANRSIHGFKWDARTIARQNVMIDETVEFQGSCWFMEKSWFEKCGFMRVEGYTGWGQEAEEIGLTTWLNGGSVITNKNTYYAHLHKGQVYGRMYYMSRDECRKSYAYSFRKWLIENRDFTISLWEKFQPMPLWPKNWKDKLCRLSS